MLLSCTKYIYKILWFLFEDFLGIWYCVSLFFKIWLLYYFNRLIIASWMYSNVVAWDFILECVLESRQIHDLLRLCCDYYITYYYYMASSVQSNRHTIILMQSSQHRATRTFMDYDSISQAMDGMHQMSCTLLIKASYTCTCSYLVCRRGLWNNQLWGKLECNIWLFDQCYKYF